MKKLKHILSVFLCSAVLLVTASCEEKPLIYVSDPVLHCEWETRVLGDDLDSILSWLSYVDTSTLKDDCRWNYNDDFCYYDNTNDGTGHVSDFSGEEMGKFVEMLRGQGEISLLNKNGSLLQLGGEYPFALCAPRSEGIYTDLHKAYRTSEYAMVGYPLHSPDSTGFVMGTYELADGAEVIFKRYHNYEVAKSCMPELENTKFTVKYNGKELAVGRADRLLFKPGGGWAQSYFCFDGEAIFSFYFIGESFAPDKTTDIPENFFKDLEITDIEIPKITEESTRLVYRFPEYDRGARDWDDYATDYTQEMKHLLSSDEQYVWLDEFKDERQELYNMGEGMDSLVEQIRENGFYFLAYDSEWYCSWKADPAENTQYPANFPLTLISAAEGVDSLIDTKPGENEKGTFRNPYSELEILAHSVQRLPIEYGCNLVLKAYYGCDNTEEIFSGLEKQELDVTVAGEEIDWYFAGNFCYDGLCPRGISYLCEYNGVILEFSVENYRRNYVVCGCEEGKAHDFWLYALGDTELDIVQMSFTD